MIAPEPLGCDECLSCQTCIERNPCPGEAGKLHYTCMCEAVECSEVTE